MIIGAASLPSKGIGVVGKQLAGNLTSSQLMLHTKATSLKKGEVYGKITVENQGDDVPTDYKFLCDKIVVATDPKTAQTLLGNKMNVYLDFSER